MKSKIIHFVFLIFIFFGFNSCKNDDDSIPNSNSINDFVWKAMNLWYYWQEDSPNLSDSRFSTDQEYQQFISSKNPVDLFFNLLYDYGNTDRFSWIVSDYHTLENQFAGINNSFGFKYGLVYRDSQSNQLFGFVQYVLPNSPASNAGIKRGDLFLKVNGQTLTDSNYQELLASNTATFEMGYLQNGQILSQNQEISLTKTVIQENPVYFKKVFEIENQKIGYLVYNGFRMNYNQELNYAIGFLKSQGISDLILDLRYNGGGSVETSAYLGSMLTGQFNEQEFTKLNFNSKASENNSSYFFQNNGKLYDSNLNETGEFILNHLNLNQLIVLTNQSTASASEMLISCLRPYINVKTIGMKTYGKTVGSITLYDSPSSSYTSTNAINTSHTWAMQPIVFEYRNSLNQSSPTFGIEPNSQINELNYLENWVELGDSNEILLSTALNTLTGKSSPIQNSHKILQENFFKHSQNIEPWGTEMYLGKGFLFNP